MREGITVEVSAADWAPPEAVVADRHSPQKNTERVVDLMRLRFAGIRTSPGRVRRLMRENGLLVPHRVRKRPDRMHDGTITSRNTIN